MISGNNSLLGSTAQTDNVKLIVCVALTIKGTFYFPEPQRNAEEVQRREKSKLEETFFIFFFSKAVKKVAPTFM